MKSDLDRNEKKMLAISPNKGVKSKALGKKTADYSWLDKHVKAQKKSQGPFHSYITGGNHVSERQEVEHSKHTSGVPKGKTKSFKNRESALHKYLTQ